LHVVAARVCHRLAVVERLELGEFVGVLLEQIADIGLFKAIEDARFGDVSRKLDEGRGIEGIVEVDEAYFNPVVELMRGEVERPVGLLGGKSTSSSTTTGSNSIPTRPTLTSRWSPTCRAGTIRQRRATRRVRSCG